MFALNFNKGMRMEKFMLNNNIKVFCVTAKSFPYGVLEAHQTLHSLAPYTKERKYFGKSRPVNGVIVYKSAAEELERRFEQTRFGKVCNQIVIGWEESKSLKTTT
jgi:hypothetical protein